MSNQYNLFENEPVVNPSSKAKKKTTSKNSYAKQKTISTGEKGIIYRGEKKEESNHPQQDIFNQKLEEVKKLKERNNKEQKILEQTRQEYYNIIQPLIEQEIEWKKAYIYKLDQYYKAKNMREWENNLIKDIIINYLEELTNEYGVILQDMEEKYLADDKDIFSNEAKAFAFEQYTGVKMDPEDFDEAMDSEEFQQKFEEKTREKQEYKAWEEEQRKKQNTYNNEDSEEQLIDTDISVLYKNLAKKIHPDLTNNEEEKEKREKLMQQLSEARKNKDLYSILSIKYQVDPENDNDEFSESQKNRLVKLLEMKIKDLKKEYTDIKVNRGFDSYLLNKFRGATKKTRQKKFNKAKKEIEENINSFKTEHERLKTKKSTKEMLKETNENYVDDYELDFLANLIFQNMK